MDTKKKLFITTVILAVLAIPTMAWALNGPFAADLDLPVIPGDEAAGETHGWMSDMHDYMWGDTPTDGSYGSMSQMHDYMWNNGELPEGSAGSTHPMGGGMWGGR